MNLLYSHEVIYIRNNINPMHSTKVINRKNAKYYYDIGEFYINEKTGVEIVTLEKKNKFLIPPNGNGVVNEELIWRITDT